MCQHAYDHWFPCTYHKYELQSTRFFPNNVDQFVSIIILSTMGNNFSRCFESNNAATSSTSIGRNIFIYFPQQMRQLSLRVPKRASSLKEWWGKKWNEQNASIFTYQQPIFSARTLPTVCISYIFIFATTVCSTMDKCLLSLFWNRIACAAMALKM